MYRYIFLIFYISSFSYISQDQFSFDSNDYIESNKEEIEEIKHKNVVLILADDLGWNDLSCVGSKVYQTPNIDRLAADGMLFEKSYAASCVCSPTRASIMTGKYPARLNLTNFVQGTRELSGAINNLPLEELTIAEAFKENGYATGMIGKWHIGVKYYPESHGFDVAIGKPHSGSPAGGYHLPNRMQLRNVKKGDYLTDKLALEAEHFIVKNKAKPFFLYQAFHSVHSPIEPKKAYYIKERQRMAKKQESTKSDIRWNTKYSAMIKSLDEAVGRIVNTLKREGLYDNTIIVFTSDNGGGHNITNNAPLKGGKGYNFEGGNRVPTIITGTGVQKNGVCKSPIISNDLYPTLLDLCGLPLEKKQHVDGVSLKKVLADSNNTLERQDLYWYFPHFSPQGGLPSSVVIDGDWKLITFYRPNNIINYELYNLSLDPSETMNLSGIKPKKLKKLKKKLKHWMGEVNAIGFVPGTISPEGFIGRNIEGKTW